MPDPTFDDDHDDSRDSRQDMIDWLSDKTPDIWFDVTQSLNWDNSERVLDWIVSQPMCDRANAAWVFWRCEPSYYAGNPERATITSDGFDLMRKILRNWKSGFYRRGELAWKSEFDHRRNYFEVVEKLPGRADPFDIPRDLFGPIKGRAPVVPRQFSQYHNQELRRLLWHLGTDVGHAPDSPEAKRSERRRQRAAILRYYGDIFGFWGRAAAWMLPAGALVIAGAFALRWWNKGLLF